MFDEVRYQNEKQFQHIFNYKYLVIYAVHLTGDLRSCMSVLTYTLTSVTINGWEPVLGGQTKKIMKSVSNPF